MARIAVEGNSPAKLRIAREVFAIGLAANPGDADLKRAVAGIDRRLKVLGDVEPPVTISRRAREVAAELDLPHNAPMLEFLSDAEEVLRRDGCPSERCSKNSWRPGATDAVVMAKLFQERSVQ